MVIDRRFLDHGIGLQVGQVSQLGLADAMIAQAFYDAADFWVGSQSAVGSAQCTGSGRRWPAGDDLTLMAHLEPAVSVFEDFHLDTGVAGTLPAGQQLQGATPVLDRVVSSYLAAMLQAEDFVQRPVSVPRAVRRLR